MAGCAAAAAPAAVSSDGRWRLEAPAPASLVLRDATGAVVRSWPVANLEGRHPSDVADLRDLPQRRSFLASFTTLPELWEISYDPAAPPIFDGLVHDYRMGEAIARGGYLGARRTPLAAPLAVLAVAAQQPMVLGTSVRADGATLLEVVHLDVRRSIARYGPVLELRLALPRVLACVADAGGGTQVLLLDTRTLTAAAPAEVLSRAPDGRCAWPATPPPAR